MAYSFGRQFRRIAAAGGDRCGFLRRRDYRGRGGGFAAQDRRSGVSQRAAGGSVECVRNVWSDLARPRVASSNGSPALCSAIGVRLFPVGSADLPGRCNRDSAQCSKIRGRACKGLRKYKRAVLRCGRPYSRAPAALTFMPAADFGGHPDEILATVHSHRPPAPRAGHKKRTIYAAYESGFARNRSERCRITQRGVVNV
jgi:hypothetical protein